MPSAHDRGHGGTCRNILVYMLFRQYGHHDIIEHLLEKAYGFYGDSRVYTLNSLATSLHFPNEKHNAKAKKLNASRKRASRIWTARDQPVCDKRRLIQASGQLTEKVVPIILDRDGPACT